VRSTLAGGGWGEESGPKHRAHPMRSDIATRLRRQRGPVRGRELGATPAERKAANQKKAHLDDGLARKG